MMVNIAKILLYAKWIRNLGIKQKRRENPSFSVYNIFKSLSVSDNAFLFVKITL